jgi:hypothetical protein
VTPEKIVKFETHLDYIMNSQNVSVSSRHG